MADLRSLIFSVGFKGNTSAVTAMDSATDKLKASMAGAASSTQNASSSMKTFGGAASNAESGISGLTSKIMGVVTAIGLVAGAKAAMDLSDTYSQTSSRINLMNDGLQTNAELQEKMYSAALDTHTAYQDTASAVASLGITASSAFSSSGEIVDFVSQLNKQFKIGGTSIEGQSAATLQLTQAMASGVLRGDELNSIYENAPTLIQSMADYMGVPVEQMRGLAEQGLITTDVIKNGVLGAAEKTNEQFKTMGTTFGQVWTDFKTRATMAFQPAIEKMNELSNSEGFKAFMDNTINSLATMGPALVGFVSGIVDLFNNPALQNFVNTAIGGISGIINTVQANMPVIVGIAAAMIAWSVATGVVGAAMTIFAGIQAVHAAAMAMTAGATLGAAAAQWGLNAAFLACPITWIVIAIIAAVAAIVYLWNTNEGFRTAVIDIWNGIVGAFQTAVTGIQTAWGAVVGFFQGVWAGIVAVFSAVVGFFVGMYQAEWDGIVAIWNGAVGFFGGVVSGIQSVFSGVSGVIINAFNGAVKFLQELPAKALEWAGDMMQGFIDGINNGITAVGDAIKGVADKITSFLHFSRPDEGPLRQYETWMPDMMQGLASGITGNIGLVKQALSGMTGQMSAKVTGEVSGSTATSASGGGGVMNFSPQITVNVNGGGTVKESFSSIEQQLNLFMDEYAQKMALRNPKVAY